VYQNNETDAMLYPIPSASFRGVQLFGAQREKQRAKKVKKRGIPISISLKSHENWLRIWKTLLKGLNVIEQLYIKWVS